jgi:hypothetical protein
MSNYNFGFIGYIPPGVSVQDNVDRALEFQRTHTARETAEWFYETVRNNGGNNYHMPQQDSMDYKQIDNKYNDIGNLNYAVVGKALGFSDILIRWLNI